MKTIASYIFLGLAVYGACVGMKGLTGAESITGIAAAALTGAGLVVLLCAIIRGEI